MEPLDLRRLLDGILLVRPPTRKLATFGDTRIEYHLVSALEGASTRLREGVVLAERPKILTADSLRERFEGFGPDSAQFSRLLQEAYGEQLRALEYRFKNEPGSSQVVHEEARLLAERIKADVDARQLPLDAVLVCPESGWQLALMKFILEQTLTAFPTHVRDLDRRGMFDPERKEADRRRAEIERLFQAAAADRGRVRELGKRLREYGLFDEYEDRFFALV